MSTDVEPASEKKRTGLAILLAMVAIAFLMIVFQSLFLLIIQTMATSLRSVILPYIIAIALNGVAFHSGHIITLKTFSNASKDAVFYSSITLYSTLYITGIFLRYVTNDPDIFVAGIICMGSIIAMFVGGKIAIASS